jgi:DNA-binding transcriptional regulator YbjK
MRTSSVIAGVAIVAVATLVWRQRAPEAAGEVPVVTPAPEVERRSPAPQPAMAATTRLVVAEDRAERLVQDIERSLRSFDEQERESVFSDMLPELIDRDAAAAGRLVERLERGPVRDQLREHVAQKWAEREREGVIGWVASLESEDERRLAAADISTQLARSDPGAAIEVADQFGIGRNDGRLEQLAQMWAETNLEDALAWIRNQPRGPQRDQLLGRIAFVQAAREPVRAADLVGSEMEPGDAQRDAALTVLREWAAQDADAAANWAARFPDSSVRERAKSELARVARLNLMGL